RQDALHGARPPLDGRGPRGARKNGLPSGLGPMRRPARRTSEDHLRKETAMAEEKTASIPGVIAYFTVSDSKAATAFYEKAFGARLIDRRETPDGRSMHVHVDINGGAMMFNDPFPEHGMEAPPQNIVLHLVVDDADAWWKR